MKTKKTLQQHRQSVRLLTFVMSAGKSSTRSRWHAFFYRNSDRHCYCKKCFQEIYEESKEKRAKDEEKDASMKKNNAGMD